jgi:hypothetical protein
MRNEIPTRSLAILAICFATGAAAFGWRWSLRYNTMIRRYECTLAAYQDKNIELEQHILNLTALLLSAGEEDPHFRRGAQMDPDTGRRWDDLATSITMLQTYQRARADMLLHWYYRKMLEIHSPPGGIAAAGRRSAVQRPLPSAEMVSFPDAKPLRAQAKTPPSAQLADSSGRWSNLRTTHPGAIAPRTIAPLAGGGL